MAARKRRRSLPFQPPTSVMILGSSSGSGSSSNALAKLAASSLKRATRKSNLNLERELHYLLDGNQVGLSQ